MFTLEVTPLFTTRIREWLTIYLRSYPEQTPEVQDETVTYLSKLACDKIQFTPASEKRVMIYLSELVSNVGMGHQDFSLLSEHFTVRIFNRFKGTWISVPYDSTEFTPVLNAQ